MESLIKYIINLINLDLPWLTEGIVRLISHVIFAGIIAVAAPASLVILTWLLRKVVARIQNRLGPNRAGPFGLLQGVADMIKMFTKEDITPTDADRVPYNIAPALATISAIMAFAVIPFAPGFAGADLNVGVLYIVAIGGLGTLAVVMAGWSSNNKYALLGAFRVVAMMLTYEIPMVMALVTVTIVAGSMSLVKIVEAQQSMWYFVSLLPVFLIFFISGVAEAGSSPFDLVEAESELIAGFHTEYSGMKFGLFMIGEFVHMFAVAFFSAVLFLGGWQIPFINVAEISAPLGPILGFIVLMIKVFFFVFVIMWIRGTLPRIRIDHLLEFGWKFLVPLSLVLLMGVAVVVKLFAPATGPAPGPLSDFGIVYENIGLLLVTYAITGLTLFVVVPFVARRSRNRGLRSVAAVDKAVPANQ